MNNIFEREMDKIKEMHRELVHATKQMKTSALLLITIEGLSELLNKEINNIKDEYTKGKISRRKAKDALERILNSINNLERYIFLVRDIFEKLQSEIYEITREIIKVPKYGVSIDYVKNELKKTIKEKLEKDFPKKDFSILELHDNTQSDFKEKIYDFLFEYKSGLIITDHHYDKLITGILDNAGVKFEKISINEKIIIVIHKFES